MKSWIKLDREITSHWIFDDAWKFRNWIDLLTIVNHTEQKINIKGIVFTCKRGETLCSLETFAKRWKCDKSKVRRFLKLLESDSMIVMKSEHLTTRISICNYDSYQGERNADETQMKRKRNADETQMTPNKNEKKEKNEKEVILDTWIDYRKSIRKSLSQATINTILKKMESYTNEQCIQVINNSIENGWQGLFWDKVETIQQVKETNKWKPAWS